MVVEFEGCEFWLPLEFLNDDEHDDFAVEKKQRGGEEVNKNGFDLFSATTSEMGSRTESEIDEDECFNGLSSKMAKTTLQDSSYSSENQQVCRLPSSPKSPLCKAAGELARRKMGQESTGLMPSMTECSVPVEQQRKNFGFATNPPPQLSYQHLQAIRQFQFEQFRRQQMMNHIQQNRRVKNGEIRPMGLPVSAWPHPGTGVRAVYSGTNLGSATNQRAGTGVFLPRTAPSTGKRKDKPACSPVSTTNRVVRGLNLNQAPVESLGVRNQAHRRPDYHTNNGFSADYGAGLKYNKKNDVMVQQKQTIAKADIQNQEVIKLPQEWTY